jgi:hypothetical protein
MAAAVLGGLAVSTVLSLLVVPAFYVVFDRIRGAVFRKRQLATPAPPAAHLSPPEQGA